MRAIDADALIDKTDDRYSLHEIGRRERDDIVDALTYAPTIQPKRGRWIRTGSGSLYDHYECSECGKAPKWGCMGDNRWKIAFTDYCPNCGADMREVSK